MPEAAEQTEAAAPSLRVRRLRMAGYRGIPELELGFGDGLTVLVGKNGAGKTAVLDLLAILLSGLAARVRTPGSAGGRALTDLDVSVGESWALGTCSVEWGGTRYLLARARGPLARSRLAREFEPSLPAVQALADTIGEAFRADPVSLPLMAFYPVDRAVVHVPLRIRQRPGDDPVSAYADAFAGKRRDFRTFFAWFRDREDAENEQRLEDPSSGPDSQLQAVRTAVAGLLSGYTNLRVRRKPRLRMEIAKPGAAKPLDIRCLSDGEKCAIALVADMARRLAIANPGLPDATKGTGVILVDEIDLHLHPAWQRLVVRQLPVIFPNCQFIISSHSPQVMSEVPAEDVWVLDRNEDGVHAYHPQSSYGLDSNAILDDIMGAESRPEVVTARLNEVRRLLTEKAYEKAEELLDELAAELRIDGEVSALQARLHWARSTPR